jgi:hypothetical protein
MVAKELWKVDQRKYPGHLAAVLGLGDMDASLLEFEIHAASFRTYCTFFARGTMSIARPTQVAAFPALADNGVKRCRWLEEQSTAARRPAYMIVSPFHNLTAAQFVTLLLFHMRYHEHLGIMKYIIYVEEGFAALAQNSDVQVQRPRPRLSSDAANPETFTAMGLRCA